MPSKPNLEAWERSVGRDVVKSHRLRRGWSQRELAEALNEMGFSHVMHTTIAKIEGGTRPLRLAEFVAIAHAFGMPWQSLMADVEPMLSERDPLADLEARLTTAQRIEDEAREEMNAAVDAAVNDFADARAQRLALAGEYRRLSEMADDGAPSDTTQ